MIGMRLCSCLVAMHRYLPRDGGAGVYDILLHCCENLRSQG